MKITLDQLVESAETLRTICLAQWPAAQIKTSYGLSKLWKQAAAELESYDAARNRLITELGELIPGTEPPQYRVTGDAYFNFEIALRELLSVEVELWDVALTLDMLSVAPITLSPVQLGGLDWLIRVDEENTNAEN